MSEILEKLRPGRDLQCYFQRPSAIAALSGTSPNGFTVSGSWRQQFDWAVIEWNRDNVFEHPAFRNLPDGDLSGLTLSYEETRVNCIPLDSDLYPTVDWPNLRIWADDGTGEKLYKISLRNYSTAIEGDYHPATVQFQLGGTPTVGDYVGIAFLGEHYPYLMAAGDTLEFAIYNIVAGVNAFSPTMRASQDGVAITLTYVGNGQTVDDSTTGANGNKIGVYTYVSGSRSEQWDAVSKQCADGTSPSKWRIVLPFASLQDPALGQVPAQAIRKLRWTYSADLQSSAFTRSEFQVVVANWTVAGNGRAYSVAGPGSRRIEDSSTDIQYSGAWNKGSGNFSGGTIHSTTENQASVICTYSSSQQHSLYLGTRLAANGALISIAIDAQAAFTVNLGVPGEDVLIRKSLGQFGPGNHTVALSHASDAGTYFYFDFLELAIPTTSLSSEDAESKLTLATDWDTDHSIALAPERTAWMINALGFKGRVNHYVGALWFYELVRVGHQYASGTISFSGVPDANQITEVYVGRTDQPVDTRNVIQHLNLIGDTAETVANAFELELNRGYTAIRAEANGNILTIYSRSMGVDGNAITLGTSLSTANFTLQVSGATLSGGTDGDWRTDLQATPRLNRAVRDWCGGFFGALKTYGIEAVASFSMELQHGDPSPDAAIAQRYPSQAPVLLNTPSLQTNFSPTSLDFWKQAYNDMAAVMAAAGIQPYLQFGEVQWWYFPYDGSGMPFYDAYTTSSFRSQFGRDLAVIASNTIDPTTIPQESAFLPGLIGNFTDQIMSFVRTTFPMCRFEVLYPPDVNDTPLNRVINYPRDAWTPAVLNCLKTESFTYTYNRNLDLAKTTIDAGISLGFPPSQRSHLVGISDSSTAWLKEVMLAEASGFESVVLFALDQFCLVGYQLPLSRGMRRSVQMG
jgi:hypothetical protein